MGRVADSAGYGADPGLDGGDRVGARDDAPKGAGVDGWRAAMARALYGPGGFFVSHAPADHFRTSAHASPRYAEAVATLLGRVDAALGRPARCAFVDLGAGRGELAAGVLAALDRLPDGGPDGLAARVRVYAVEVAGRPAGLDDRVVWTATPPEGVEGLLFANEWLDNVPLEVAEVDATGVPRYVRVDGTGAETLGGPLSASDARWLARWWPLDTGPGAGRRVEPGRRVELGGTRDAAWAAAVGRLRRGLAVAVDYGHTRATRPPYGTLTGYRDGRQVSAVPDGTRDLTAHVALDACAAAGAAVADAAGLLCGQRQALRALGVRGERPPLTLASRDPAGYVRALARAGEAAELTDPAGLGGHLWLSQPVGLPSGTVSALLPDAAGTSRPVGRATGAPPGSVAGAPDRACGGAEPG